MKYNDTTKSFKRTLHEAFPNTVTAAKWYECPEETPWLRVSSVAIWGIVFLTISYVIGKILT